MLPLFFAGCIQGSTTPCECPAEVRGHAVELGGVCSCLEIPAVPFSTDGATFFIDAEATEGDGSSASPWSVPHWPTVDAALATRDVTLVFDPSDTFSDRLQVLRTDSGPHRLVLQGSDGTGARARVAGITTTFDPIPRHRVTVTGFEITRSRDKGIFWIGGDDVLLYDNVVHNNRGTPAISLEYSRRTGFISHNLRIIGNHVYDQNGECIYIGGSEGLDEDSHRGLEISYNLVHGCRSVLSSQHDGINVKDRISDVQVERNVVIGGDWGIEVASAGVYRGNLTINAGREGFHVSDGFQALPDMQFTDNVSIGAGHDGLQLTANLAPTGQITIEGLTVLGAGEIGFAVGGNHNVNAILRDVVIADVPVAFDGWGQGTVEIESCATRNADTEFDRFFDGQAPCDPASPVRDGPVAGADGIFFTADDPWLEAGGAALTR